MDLTRLILRPVLFLLAMVMVTVASSSSQVPADSFRYSDGGIPFDYQDEAKRAPPKKHDRSAYYRNLSHQLKRQQNKWYAKRLKSYRFTMQNQCFCTPNYRLPIHITVKQGRVRKAYTSAEVNVIHRAKTINQLFAMINNAINTKAYRIDVNYHPRLGYPRSIYIDRDRRIADEEISIKVRNLKAIRGGGNGQNRPKKFSYCSEPRPRFCTREYRPVCGVGRKGYRRTFSNGCTACAEPKVKKHSLGACK